MNFVPLNVFSNYALLQSALTLDDYFTLLKTRNIKVAGISDPGYLFSYPHFSKLATKNNITPLYGVRLKVEDTDLVFFIKNEAGYLDLLALYELEFSGNLYAESLKNLTKNLITILPTNNINNLNLKRDNYRDYFRKWALVTDDFFVGLEHESVEFSNVLREFCDRFAYNIVAFPHILYKEPSDYKTYLMIKAIREGTTLNINDHPSGPDYFLTEGELADFYFDEELENTVSISKKIAFNFVTKHDLKLPLPGQYDPAQKIKELTLKGLAKYGLSTDEKYLTRLNYELKVIADLNFTNYFLIVSDYVNYAKDNGILVGYGRGSAPGSLVSYALGITSADPLKYDLLFERFLNPARQSMPDIDIDFMDTRRGEILDYLKATYGEDHVAQIVTFQTNAAKASLRDTGRIFSIDLKFINRLSASLGNYLLPLRESYKKIPAFKRLIDEDKFNLSIIKEAVKLEGFPRQTGMHAAGVILDGAPLSKSLATFVHNGIRMSQFEMGFLESQGFLKVDILGLSNLTLIDNIIKRVALEENIQRDFYNLSFDDPKIYDVIRNGHTLGLFQLESAGMRKAIRDILPTNFNDVSALLALYRPGPMQYIKDYGLAKNGNKEVTYLNEDFRRVLAPTYGIMIYQEQIMQIAEVMAGFSLAEADILRRAISKKDETNILKQKTSFLEGAAKKGYSSADSQKVFNDILKFADYGFNKSHSVVYAMTTMALAYLKTYHPLAFYSELLPNVLGDAKKFQALRQELKERNIKLLLPSIVDSTSVFIRKDDNLLFPLHAIVGLNKDSASKIIKLRTEAPFTNLENFFYRAYSANVQEEDITALIEAGALDTFNPNRAYLKEMFMTYLPTLETRLFSSEDALSALLVNEVTEDPKLKIQNEAARLRFPLSQNPLELLNIRGYLSLSELLEKTSGTFQVYGIISATNQIKTRAGDAMAFATLTNFDETLDLVFFPRVYSLVAPLVTNAVYLLSGILEQKDGTPQFVVNNLERYDHD